MPSYQDFLNEVANELKALVAKSWRDFGAQATADAQAFLEQSRADLERWTNLVRDQQLTLQDLEFLLAAKKDLAKLTALKQAGLAQVQLERFRNGLVSVLIDAATKVLV